MIVWYVGTAGILVWILGFYLRICDTRKKIAADRAMAAAWQLSIHGNTDRSILEVCDMYPQNVEPLLKWFDVVYDRQEFEEAVRRAEILRNKFPKHPGGYERGAAALYHCGRVEDADNLLRAGVKRLGQKQSLIRAQAHLYLNKRDFRLASQRFNDLRRRFPDDKDGYIMGAIAEEALNRPDIADSLLKEVIEGRLKCAIEHVLSRYATYPECKANWEEASRRWELCCQRLPLKRTGYIRRSRCLRHLGDWQGAKNLIVSAQVLFPEDSEIKAEINYIGVRSQALID